MDKPSSLKLKTNNGREERLIRSLYMIAGVAVAVGLLLQRLLLP